MTENPAGYRRAADASYLYVMCALVFCFFAGPVVSHALGDWNISVSLKNFLCSLVFFLPVMLGAVLPRLVIGKKENLDFSLLFPLFRKGWHGKGRGLLFSFLIGFLMQIPAMGITTAVRYLFQEFGLKTAEQASVDLLLHASGVREYILLAVPALFLAPLAEEVAFRLVIYEKSRQYLPETAAVAVTSFLFAVIHGNPAAFPTLFMAGSLWQLLFVKSGSLAYSATAHFAFNLSSVFLLFFRTVF